MQHERTVIQAAFSGILKSMKYSTLFFDLDDTLYPAQSGLWDIIKDRISLYMYECLQLPWEEIPSRRAGYYREFGTTMRGLINDFDIDPEEYLQFVHDIPLADYLSPDPALNALIKSYPQQKIIFTNADTKHAQRVMEALQVNDCFDRIIDIHTMSPYCKPLLEAYRIALKVAGEKDPQACVLLDDSPSNLASAKSLGFFTVRVGGNDHMQNYDVQIATIKELADVLPND
jgi:putative hydrolase of the HAD superfamily